MHKLLALIKAKNKQEWVIAGALGFCVLAGVFYVFASSANTVIDDNDTTAKPSVNDNFSSSIEHGDLKTYFTNQINKKLTEQSDKVKTVEEQVGQILKIKEDDIALLKQQNDSLEQKIRELSEKIDSRSNGAKSNYSQNNDFTPGQYDAVALPAMGSNNNSAQHNNFNSVIASDEIELVSVTLNNAKPMFKDVTTYLPAGTHIRGVILGGVDAHTEVYGNSQTRVVTIRFVDNGNIPNGFKGNMKDCTMLASAWGNASSERVAMRGERLTCVGKTGKILETDVVATIYGSDGRQDVRGRAVYPESKLLTRAFMSGALSGIGNGVAQSFSTQSISPLGVTASVAAGDVFKQGAANGVGKGLDKLSDYYIKRAEQLQPIIQVGSGTVVDVVVQKGFYLDGLQHEQIATNTPGTPFEESQSPVSAKLAAQNIVNNVSEEMS
ncbi:MAG: hypothetical protein KBD25_00465 [Rickettsiaceae bacterium]|nr:hypothetical protein [Rickettsiaceae bacterium]